jgi:mono/diheme cytochrome c family protein
LNKHVVVAVLVGTLAGTCVAQDAERGRKLFMDTRGVTGKQVGNCVVCHADAEALRGMIDNRGGKPTDQRFVRGMLQRAIDGSVAGAANAKAQYRGVLTPRDLDDLSAWIARARAA